MNMIRHGDILLVATTDPIPDGLNRHTGRLTLATGEATGHAHIIDNPAATLYGDELETRFLEVIGDEVDLIHTSTPKDHDTLTIPPGTYRVLRQREWAPEAVRRVAD